MSSEQTLDVKTFGGFFGGTHIVLGDGRVQHSASLGHLDIALSRPFSPFVKAWRNLCLTLPHSFTQDGDGVGADGPTSGEGSGSAVPGDDGHQDQRPPESTVRAHFSFV